MNDWSITIAIFRLRYRFKKIKSLLEYARTPGAIQMYTRPLGAYPEYIACFSKNPDSVSQWIAYADNGQGIAIGFDEEEFERLAVEEGLEYQGVTYVSEDDIRQHIPSVYDDLVENLSGNNLHMMDQAMERIMQFFPDGVSYKTTHYASECEKRIIYDYPTEVDNLPDEWEIKEIGVYAKRNLMNTYRLNFGRNPLTHTVTHITIVSYGQGSTICCTSILRICELKF